MQTVLSSIPAIWSDCGLEAVRAKVKSAPITEHSEAHLLILFLMFQTHYVLRDVSVISQVYTPGSAVMCVRASPHRFEEG